MLIEQNISLYARESVALFSGQTMGRKNPIPLFKLVLKKIGRLLARIKIDQIYPLCALFEIKQQLEAVEKQVNGAIDVFENRLKQAGISKSAFEFQAQSTLTISFGNPLIYQLAQLTQKFDQLMCLLSLAKHTGILPPQAFFQEKDKHWLAMSGFILNIIRVNLQTLPSVHLDDYLADTPLYQEAKQKFAEIDMTILHAALKQSFLPYLAAEKLENYQRALREKAKQQRDIKNQKISKAPTLSSEAEIRSSSQLDDVSIVVNQPDVNLIIEERI